MLWLPACFCNDELHLPVITRPRSHRNSECCIFKSGPSDSISLLSSKTPWCLLRSDHTPWVPQTCCSITWIWLAHGSERPSCLSRIDLPLLTAYKAEISHHVLGVFLCVFSHTLQHHLSRGHSPRGFQVLTSFALIRVAQDQADRLIFPALHGAVWQ